MTSASKKVCFYITTRGNYAKTATVIEALKDKVEIQYITGMDCPGDMEFYGRVERLHRIDGYKMQEPGRICGSCADALWLLKPSLFVIVADRWECLPAAMSAYYMGISIAHLEGGEESDCLDNRIRNAITQLATIHFPCSRKSFERVVELIGSDDRDVTLSGCTSFGMLLQYVDAPFHVPVLKMKMPYLLVVFHPDRMAPDLAFERFRPLLWAISELQMETYWIRPNIDVNSDKINDHLNKIKWPFIHVTDSLRIEQYAALMAHAACVIGNSSSGIREAGFLGVPVVNVGERQGCRERDINVVNVSCETKAIIEAVRKQVAHGLYESDYTYGDGRAGEKVAEVILDYLEVKESAYDAA